MAPFKHYRDAAGAYLGQFNVAPAGGIEAPRPDHGAQRWNGAAWAGDPPPPPKSRADLLEAALVKQGVIVPADVEAEKGS